MVELTLDAPEFVEYVEKSDGGPAGVVYNVPYTAPLEAWR
jgi:hypothetical protein